MSVWQPGPRPAWVTALNENSDPAWIGLDADALAAEASAKTGGLDDFGDERFWEPFRIFVQSLREEAKLHTVGALLIRDDLVSALETRLRITETRKRHPEVCAEAVEKPIFITGLPRTGTSITHELLAADPRHRAPLHWEVRNPWPAPEAATYRTDPRIERADRQIRLWCEIVPEYDTMHELGGAIPVEDVQVMAASFVSDEWMGRHVVPSYAAWYGACDRVPAFEFHKQMLQHLQWKCPGERWVLKSPSHMSQLDALLAVYPDARIVFTHRDPLKVLPSVVSILYSTAYVRSDEVDAGAMASWFDGKACRALLDGMTALRESGQLPESQCFDLRYADLMRDPVAALAGVYEHFEIDYPDSSRRAQQRYIDEKPKGRHGSHRYDFSDTGLDLDEERERFRDYYERYGVLNEA
ncbi:MAG: sulfotransferase [Spirochaetaceae bacterium]|nr:sulfotransferase [Myxococcales bacterium]MCB9722452.1 sulfotransferase [Spirochaetaceae bacterium]